MRTWSSALQPTPTSSLRTLADTSGRYGLRGLGRFVGELTAQKNVLSVPPSPLFRRLQAKYNTCISLSTPPSPLSNARPPPFASQTTNGTNLRVGNDVIPRERVCVRIPTCRKRTSAWLHTYLLYHEPRDIEVQVTHSSLTPTLPYQTVPGTTSH